MAAVTTPPDPKTPTGTPPVPERDPGIVRNPGVEEPPETIPEPVNEPPVDSDRRDTPERIYEPDEQETTP